jgi:hypothetical protein
MGSRLPRGASWIFRENASLDLRKRQQISNYEYVHPALLPEVEIVSLSDNLGLDCIAPPTVNGSITFVVFRSESSTGCMRGTAVFHALVWFHLFPERKCVHAPQLEATFAGVHAN